MMEYAEKNKVELLSPAGDMERLSAALSFGADAVYLAGREFGMRSAPKNFGEDELCRAAKLCHSYGAKLYLTCNTVPRNEELSRLPGFLEFARDAGVGEMWLTHYSPSLIRPEDYMDGVREIFPQSYPGKDGKSVELNFEEE